MMDFKQKLPVSYLLFTLRGRISRSVFWTAMLFACCTFYVMYNLFLGVLGLSIGWVLYPMLFWVCAAVSAKRLHDTGKSGYLLLASLIPVFGPLWLLYMLGLKKGDVTQNRYSNVPGTKSDYLKNDEGKKLVHLKKDERIIDDVTKLNPILVNKVARPETVMELCELIKTSIGPLSIGGGRFSMGGQTASTDTLHIDMRRLNRILSFSKDAKTIKVEAGIRWCDIQKHIDPFDLSIKIMQTYANFTVGGALSVNAHGRYMGLGPVVLSVLSIEVVLADGSLIEATKNKNEEIFYAAIGGYNAIGIIVSAELQLADNVAIKRVNRQMNYTEYLNFFFNNVRYNPKAVFHNGDIYPPHYKKMRAITWEETTEKPTVKTRLMPLKESYPLERYFLWAFTSTPFGKWRRQYLIDPLLYLSKKIHWRNYEAGYDVAELEPKSRTASTYVLLEYFVPMHNFDEFTKSMAEIFIRHNVNVLNVSVRHALADPGTYLAWAREEVFAFVVYYKQETHEAAKQAVAVWTRKLADAVIAVKGCYYLPYQIHPTAEQFHKAYPHAVKLFELKSRLDPEYKFRNSLWDTYYKPLYHHQNEN
ncbi:FAD-binding protein [Desertivirga xinjiangensis]|uniref:FAD-binding protein n=1 Tax=Desertivirga xinjiangensis TaxID=539206 RepID=UPI00210E2C6E|nr:FAD-binding protein [Pedobacter xinjiangensis]